MQQSTSRALWYIMSGVVAGMVVSVVLPQMFIIRYHPLHVLLACMFAGSVVGLIFSIADNK